MNAGGILAHYLTIAASNSRMFLDCLYALLTIFGVLNVPRRKNQGLLGLENVVAAANHYACSLRFQETAFANNLLFHCLYDWVRRLVATKWSFGLCCWL